MTLANDFRSTFGTQAYKEVLNGSFRHIPDFMEEVRKNESRKFAFAICELTIRKCLLSHEHASELRKKITQEKAEAFLREHRHELGRFKYLPYPSLFVNRERDYDFLLTNHERRKRREEKKQMRDKEECERTRQARRSISHTQTRLV